MRLQNSIVAPKLMVARETWTLSKSQIDIQTVDGCWYTTGLTLKDKQKNLEINEHTGMKSIGDRCQKNGRSVVGGKKV